MTNAERTAGHLAIIGLEAGRDQFHFPPPKILSSQPANASIEGPARQYCVQIHKGFVSQSKNVPHGLAGCDVGWILDPGIEGLSHTRRNRISVGCLLNISPNLGPLLYADEAPLKLVH